MLIVSITLPIATTAELRPELRPRPRLLLVLDPPWARVLAPGALEACLRGQHLGSDVHRAGCAQVQAYQPSGNKRPCRKPCKAQERVCVSSCV